MRLIVGLGNPGQQYEKTRHNLGFLLLRQFADSQGIKFRPSSLFHGELAGGMVGDEKFYLLLPTTYMNLSGKAVKRCAEYYKIDAHDILIVSDDVNLPFGKLRFRTEGSAGGHNGLKSVESYLGTTKYPRLRVGVGDRDFGDLSDYVLGEFKQEEKEQLPKIYEAGAQILNQWLGEKTHE